MTLKKLFDGMKLGLPQSAGNMVVIPITTDNPNTDVSDDLLVQIRSDTDYGHLTLENLDDKPVIVPQGSAFMNKQSAQDRAVLSADVIKKKGNKVVNVGCIEQSQCGHMESGTADMTSIPISIRMAALEINRPGYDVLWNDIRAYNEKMGVGSRSHLRDFYEKMDKELEQFVAQFESVEKQVGAIILINNKVIGIEIYPNYGSWKKIWRQLIRDCYGAEAIGIIKKGKAIAFKPIISVDKVNSFEDLELEAKNIIAKTTENIMSVVEPTLEQEDTCLASSNIVDDFTISKNIAGSLSGQSIKKSDKLVYASMIARVG